MPIQYNSSEASLIIYNTGYTVFANYDVHIENIMYMKHYINYIFAFFAIIKMIDHLSVLIWFLVWSSCDITQSGFETRFDFQAQLLLN